MHQKHARKKEKNYLKISYITYIPALLLTKMRGFGAVKGTITTYGTKRCTLTKQRIGKIKNNAKTPERNRL